jgi:hypothetical protein
VKEIFRTQITDNEIKSLLNRAILAPTNKEVDAINEKMQRSIKGKQERVYYSRKDIQEYKKSINMLSSS